MADINMEQTPKAGIDAMNAKSGALLHIWQENASRMMRANERAMHGLMSAAKLEMELGQELVARRIEAIKFVTDGGRPAEKMQSHIESSLHDMERVMATMLEASNKVREGFTDAAKLLFEETLEQAKEMTGEAKEFSASMPKAARKTVHEATDA